ncbi:MAG: dockerin type I domain-containing protein [Ruminococcus sp.]|nr:dockerin type I domain-containing protein [Ruminococcus sp.]
MCTDDDITEADFDFLSDEFSVSIDSNNNVQFYKNDEELSYGVSEWSDLFLVMKDSVENIPAVYGAYIDHDYILTLGVYPEYEDVQTYTLTDFYGDLDDDEVITVQDAFYCLKACAEIAAGNDDGLTVVQRTIADVNSDGEITIQDAYTIQRYFANLSAGHEIGWENLID